MKTLILTLALLAPAAHAEQSAMQLRYEICMDDLKTLFQEAGPGSDDPVLATRILNKQAQCNRLKKAAKAAAPKAATK